MTAEMKQNSADAIAIVVKFLSRMAPETVEAAYKIWKENK